MPVYFAFVSVVLIWSTTPLAIHWSNTSFDFVTALSARIVIAALIGWIILRVMGQTLVQKPTDYRQFFAGSLGLFPTMLLVYWAAQTVPSGVMSVMFGLFPFWVGVWNLVLLKHNDFSPLKVVALVLAIVGLCLMNIGQLRIGIDGVWGMLAIIVATALWALSSVWLKSFPSAIKPFRQTVGSMAIVAPAFVVIWLLFGETLHALFSNTLEPRSLIGVSYLVVTGSLLGHTLFFYVLINCRVTSVALIPLITPVLAIALGWVVEGEVIGPVKLAGAVVLLFALALYQGVIGSVFRLMCARGVARRSSLPL